MTIQNLMNMSSLIGILLHHGCSPHDDNWFRFCELQPKPQSTRFQPSQYYCDDHFRPSRSSSDNLSLTSCHSCTHKYQLLFHWKVHHNLSNRCNSGLQYTRCVISSTYLKPKYIPLKVLLLTTTVDQIDT